MPDTATLQTWLEQVEEAIQQLSLGEKTESFSFDGKSQSFNKTDLALLKARRAELRMQLGLGSGRRPFGVSF